jgi:hypothetical protein
VLVPVKNVVRADTIELASVGRYAPFLMTSVLLALLATLRGIVRSRAALHLEILALRHQVQVLQRSQPPRLRLAHADRWLWAWMSHRLRG